MWGPNHDIFIMWKNCGHFLSPTIFTNILEYSLAKQGHRLRKKCNMECREKHVEARSLGTPNVKTYTWKQLWDHRKYPQRKVLVYKCSDCQQEIPRSWGNVAQWLLCCLQPAGLGPLSHDPTLRGGLGRGSLLWSMFAYLSWDEISFDRYSLSLNIFQDLWVSLFDHIISNLLEC